METWVINLLSSINVGNGDRQIGDRVDRHNGFQMMQTWMTQLNLQLSGLLGLRQLLVAGYFSFSTHCADRGFGSALGIKIVKTILKHLKFIDGAIRLVHCEDGFWMGDISQLELGSHILE